MPDRDSGRGAPKAAMPPGLQTWASTPAAVRPVGRLAPRGLNRPWGTRVTDLPRLHVCTTCRAGRPLAEGETPPGAIFRDALQAHMADSGHAPFAVQPVVCLSSCSQGCAAAISAPGKWTYILGNLTPEKIPDLLAYGALYAASATGTVMPSRRPAALRDMILGRVPCLETTP